jgi:hypothetical protein
MNEKAEIRRQLQRALGQDVPDLVWNSQYVQDAARDFLKAETDDDRTEEWQTLKEGARERLVYWNGGRQEVLSGVRAGAHGGSRDMREAEERDNGKRIGGLDAWELFGDRTKAMTGAMSALFALIGDQIPEVMAFRERILPGRYLTAEEAHSLIASYAARTLCPSQFEEWCIPFVGHRAEVLDTAAQGAGFNPVDDCMTIRVDPPGITKTVRYAFPQEGDPNTRCIVQSGAVIPIHTHFPIESHGDHHYPSWLWPGSVVDELYELSAELADAFDWPGGSRGNPSGTRTRSQSAAWFVLTGEAPQVRPIDAKWAQKYGSTHLAPQWRIQLTIPPWLPEEEALQAFRTLRRQRPAGRQMPKTAKPLEVARFVWVRERLDGYREPAPWTAWLQQWNEEHPGHRIESASNFRTYFFRGFAAVTHLNIGSPTFGGKQRETSDPT